MTNSPTSTSDQALREARDAAWVQWQLSDADSIYEAEGYDHFCAGYDAGRASTLATIQAFTAEVERLKGERDEADRRAGAAERSLEYERDTTRRRSHWLSDAKRSRGYSDNTSFNVVWAETCAKADAHDALAQELGRTCGEVMTARVEQDVIAEAHAGANEVMHSALASARALAERVTELEAALKPFCFGDPAIERILYDGMPDDAPGTFTIKLGDIRAARAAIEESDEGDRHGK